ncbi:DUF692 domain-containing protein [Marinomonas spartinae]|uniref:MNIO family bufferin maturase n=1 Tax=Marinomonas spartinae TaxID=1792290 RepID=UPI0018F13193|nr:DUF692 domain-containing protein [Marinomonas spartinae]MBJ7554910.1 DUF692 domain-containing protein [Marinomonas spartinae]
MTNHPLMKNVSLAGSGAHPQSELDIQNLLGLGLRSQHFHEILQHQPDVAWFEIISENFMDSGGRPRHILNQIAQHYPIVMHGVSLSIGSTDPLDWQYLQHLKKLADDIQPLWISDHLCWTGVLNINSHDLLPLPLTEESLQHVCERILQVQDFLKRPLVVENPSTYMHFKHSVIPEWEFFNELFRRTQCEMLLDVNNVYVSAFNNQFDPMTYLRGLEFSAVRQMHLAGHQHCGNYIIDTHDRQVSEEVWPLFQYAWQQTGGVATCLEWDGNIPHFSDYLEELHQAKHVLVDGHVKRSNTTVPHLVDQPIATPIDFLVSNTRK